MKDKIEFFKNIEDIGSLYLDYIFIEDGYLVFFTLSDDNKELYICSCCDIRGKQRWIVTKTNDKTIEDMLGNKISVRDVFLLQENSILITWDLKLEILKTESVKTTSINSQDLPTDNIYFEPNYRKILDYRKHRLAHV